MNILAINPWIYDFAAYDFWLKPYGFLVILEYLRAHSCHIDYIDCLGLKETHADYGRGKYHAEIIDKPELFAKIPRYYKRYGITLEDFENKLPDQAPDYILITSSMTYWYPGITQALEIIQRHFPHTPVIIGGTYATLCFEHAKKTYTHAHILPNEQLPKLFDFLHVPYDIENLYTTLPEYDAYYPSLDFVVLRTSWGCPFNCSYCAIKQLSGALSLRIAPHIIAAYIQKYAQKNIKDFVLYDDAFLFDQIQVKETLRAIKRLNAGLRFHTPNALHFRYLDQEIACLLKQCGFINPHFGLETLDPQLQRQWGDKVTRQDLERGVKLLKNAGYKNGEFSAYLLLGFPGQNVSVLKDDVEWLHSLGARTSFAEFSPVPGTSMFERYQSEFSEPLLHNNSVFGAFQEKNIREFWEIKNYLRKLNRSFVKPANV